MTDSDSSDARDSTPSDSADANSQREAAATDDSDRPALLLDAMCGKLAPYLRMCGHDAAFVLDRFDAAPADEAIVELAREEGRVIVTRDRRVAELAPEAILLTERDPVDQLGELVAAGLPLELADEPTRCGACNGPLERVAPVESTPEYAPDAAEADVWRCRDCGQHFWKGSHWADVAERLAGL